MQPGISEGQEVCGRCLQPVSHNDAKCPRCNMPRMRTRRLTIWLGVAGLAALVFVVLLMIKVIRDADFAATPPDNPDAEQSSAPSQPSQPDKPPPLNK